MQTVEQQAQAIYDMWQTTAARWAKVGALRGKIAEQAAVTREEITAHVARCEDLAVRYRVTMDPVALWGEDLEARALGKSRANAGRRGAKTLRNTYGDEAAANIIHRARSSR